MACVPSLAPPVPVSVTKRVVVFSDLHFNPFSDPTLVDSLARADVSHWRAIFERSSHKSFSPYYSDSNYPLFASALEAMQRAESSPELVLFAGDFIAHNFQLNFRRTARDTSAAALAAFTAKTNLFLAREIGAAFPSAQILPALGNNDSGCGDYMSQPGSAFLRSFAEAWQPLVSRRGSAPAFVETFSRSGHYSATAPVAGARIVVLNDVYWSPRYANACGSVAATPGREALAWLEGVVTESRAKGETVWLLTHAPVGVDVFATRNTDSVVNMLDPAYSSALMSLVQRSGGTVRYGIYGHTHMNDFRVMSDTSGVPMLGNQGIPAVSPIFANNPAFVVLSLDSASGTITNYAVHALTNLRVAGTSAPAAWAKEYDFVDAFHVGGPSAQSLDRLQRAMASDSTLRASFARFYDSGSGRANISASWRAYWCGIENVLPASYARCNRQP
jgi:sphingomyelin phosphodiesterase acid-like 3